MKFEHEAHVMIILLLISVYFIQTNYQWRPEESDPENAGQGP